MIKHESQRGYFAHELYEQMKANPNIFLLVGGLGYKIFDQHFKDFPSQCINCEASEQTMVGIAVGLALKGKIPFVYTISSFFLRAAETISLYLDHEQIPVHLVGSGRDQDYEHDGISHDATAVQKFLDNCYGIIHYYPDTNGRVTEMTQLMINSTTPSFISLRR